MDAYSLSKPRARSTFPWNHNATGIAVVITVEDTVALVFEDGTHQPGNAGIILD